MTDDHPPFERIAVFCGSNFGIDPAYRETAAVFGELIASRGIGLVYGGGNVGLMGILADTVMKAGGKVIGVIPQHLRDREVAHFGITQLQVVDSMHKRKRLIYEQSDVLVALPGGIGTFEELLEAMTWNQLGLHDKPLGLLNVKGYFDPLVAMFDRAEEHKFLRSEQRERLLVESDPERLLQALAAARLAP